MIHAPEIERSILGAMISRPTSIDKVRVEITPEMFFDQNYRTIYEAILYLDQNTDIALLAERLKKVGKLEDVGGPYGLSQLLQGEIYGNVSAWCAVVKQKYARRKAIEIGALLQQIGNDEMKDELDSFTEIDKAHQQLSDILFGSRQAELFSDVAVESLRQLKERIERHRSGEIPGIKTGIKLLEQVTGGWIPGDLVVLAGRPGMGKTALALHFVKMAAEQRKHVYVFSLEMTNPRLVDRMIIGHSKIDPYKYRMGRLSDTEYDRASGWAAEHSDMPIFMDEKSLVSIDYIVSRCRMMARRRQLDLVIIDYLQLINMAQEKGTTRDQAIGVVTRKLKAMAKELNVPVLLLSQLNRMVEDRSDKRPSLRDLRESGNIEQDADLVLFAFRPAYYDIKEFEGEPTNGVMVLDIAKHRNGDSNLDVKFYHNDSLTDFYDEQLTDMPF